MISYERVRELFDYDEGSGRLTAKKRRGSRILEGDVVGTISKGYLQCRVDHDIYRVHRIIWLWYYGYMPENAIDHINRDGLDNRIGNLREVSKQCNAVNIQTFKNNTSGIRGVFWSCKNNSWVARIKVNQKTIHLGQYKCKLEAACNRLAAEQCLGWDTCITSSACKYVSENKRKV